MRAILSNASKEVSVIAGMLLARFSATDLFDWGYNVQCSEYIDMIKTSIINPQYVRNK